MSTRPSSSFSTPEIASRSGRISAAGVIAADSAAPRRTTASTSSATVRAVGVGDDQVIARPHFARAGWPSRARTSKTGTMRPCRSMTPRTPRGASGSGAISTARTTRSTTAARRRTLVRRSRMTNESEETPVMAPASFPPPPRMTIPHSMRPAVTGLSYCASALLPSEWCVGGSAGRLWPSPPFPACRATAARPRAGEAGMGITYLNISRAGSFADASRQSPAAGRTIVFDVSGHIHVNKTQLAKSPQRAECRHRHELLKTGAGIWTLTGSGAWNGGTMAQNGSHTVHGDGVMTPGFSPSPTPARPARSGSIA